MSPKKTYFLVKNNDYAPDKLIKLGQLIADLREPHRAYAGTPLDKLPEVHRAWERGYEREKARDWSIGLGVFAQFAASMVGVGPDAEGNVSRKHLNNWRFARLETEFIEPDDEYVARCVAPGTDARTYLEKNKLFGRLYMVTGVRIARGASASSEAATEYGADVTVAVNLTAAGAPIELGPKTSFTTSSGEKEKYEESSDFVYAYRLRKVKLDWSGNVTSKEVTGGDLLGVDDDDEDAESERSDAEDDLGEINSVTLEGADFGTFQVPNGFKATTVKNEDGGGQDDGEDCVVLWPSS